LIGADFITAGFAGSSAYTQPDKGGRVDPTGAGSTDLLAALIGVAKKTGLISDIG
jgi:hypothetical protein